jgi:hypothetical protein
VFEGITAAGTVPDSHRIPLHRDGSNHPITTKFRRKGTTFFPNHQPNPQKIQNKNEKVCRKYIEKHLILSILLELWPCFDLVSENVFVEKLLQFSARNEFN